MKIIVFSAIVAVYRREQLLFADAFLPESIPQVDRIALDKISVSEAEPI